MFGNHMEPPREVSVVRPKEIDQPIAQDWRGGDVYDGDRGYFIDGEIVLEHDIEKFIQSKYGKADYL